MNATRTTRYRAGEAISLDSLRDFVGATKDLDGGLHVVVETEAGQRDAVYYYLTVTETLND